MTRPPIDLKPSEAFLASLRVWLLGLAALLLDALSPKRGRKGLARDIALLLRGCLGRVETNLKRAMLPLAIARLTPRERVRCRLGGYALRRWRPSFMRLLTQSAFPGQRGRSIRVRIDRLRAVLDDPERWIARLMRRIARGFNGMHVILAAPPVARSYAVADRPPAFADSS